MAEKKKVPPHKCDACGKGWDCGSSCEEATAGKVTTVRCTECQGKTAYSKPYYKYSSPAQVTAPQTDAILQAGQAFQWGNQPAQQEVWTVAGASLGQIFSETIINGNR